MDFIFTGAEPIDLRIPGNRPYTAPVLPSPNVQTTNDPLLYKFIFSEDNPHRALFENPNAPKPAPKGKGKGANTEETA